MDDAVRLVQLFAQALGRRSRIGAGRNLTGTESAGTLGVGVGLSVWANAGPATSVTPPINSRSRELMAIMVLNVLMCGSFPWGIVMVARKAMHRNPLNLRGSTDPLCSGMTMRWLAHILACTCMSDATLRAKQRLFPASMSASDLDEFRLLQRLLRVAMMRWSRGE
jgi:hypothetical protein